MNNLYYIQDSRSIVGNCILWWGKNKSGYVCDINDAGKYSKEEAREICKRDTDIAWDCDYIDNKISRHVRRDRLDCMSSGIGE